MGDATPVTVFQPMSGEGIMAGKSLGAKYLLCALGLGACLAWAQGGLHAPRTLSDLLPRGARKLTGGFVFRSGTGGGSIAAALPSDQPCTGHERDVARLHLDIHARSEKSPLMAMQWEGLQQTIENARNEYARKKAQLEKGGKGRSGPITVENGPGGRMVSYEYRAPDHTGSCASTWLTAITHTDTSYAIVEIHGMITREGAKRAAEQVMANVDRTDFSRLRP